MSGGVYGGGLFRRVLVYFERDVVQSLKKKPFCLQTKLVGSCLTLARIQCVQDMPAKTVQR